MLERHCLLSWCLLGLRAGRRGCRQDFGRQGHKGQRRERRQQRGPRSVSGAGLKGGRQSSLTSVLSL